MYPIKYPEAQKCLTKPSDLTDDECGELWVLVNNQGQVISCWKLTWKEWFSILFFGRIWVWVWSGHTQPPISLLATKTIFKKSKNG